MAYQNQKVRPRQVVAPNTQTQDLGIVSNVPMGDWNATTQYQKLNMVRYNGATYMAKKQNRGFEPTVTTDWQQVWQVVVYDGGDVEPTGTYPEMTVGNATNATNAENDGTGANIADQFSQVGSDIQGLREDFANESHFRGMFESVSALQAAYPTATPNDYAYIVGGNIYIYQNGAWTNSNQPTPVSSIPASDATPLMDGTGTPGTSGNYARGDHRHPSDTTKANTSGTYPNMRVGNATNADYATYDEDGNPIPETYAKQSGTYANMTVGRANQASRLTNARAIDGVSFDGSAAITHYGTCSTAASTTIKDVQIAGFTLTTGARVAVKFSNTNSVSAPQLRVYSSTTSDGTAKTIYFPSSTTNAKNVLAAGRIIEFIYDGTNWVMISGDPLAAYPVGAYYISNESTSPAQLFGGSWTAITGRFLYCNSGTGTGGSSSVTLKESNIPAHYHTLAADGKPASSEWVGVYDNNYISSSVSAGQYSYELQGVTDSLPWRGRSSTVGSGASFDIMPPYQTVYAWRRTS